MAHAEVQARSHSADLNREKRCRGTVLAWGSRERSSKPRCSAAGDRAGCRRRQLNAVEIPCRGVPRQVPADVTNARSAGDARRLDEVGRERGPAHNPSRSSRGSKTAASKILGSCSTRPLKLARSCRRGPWGRDNGSSRRTSRMELSPTPGALHTAPHAGVARDLGQRQGAADRTNLETRSFLEPTRRARAR